MEGILVNGSSRASERSTCLGCSPVSGRLLQQGR